MKYAINTTTQEILAFDVEDFNTVAKKYRTGDWQEATQGEADFYELEKAKKAKCAEIYTLRDQNISEDSIRHSEAEAAEAAINALTSVTDIDNEDLTQYFS